MEAHDMLDLHLADAGRGQGTGREGQGRRAGDRDGGTGPEGRGQREPARSEDSTRSGQGAGRCGYEPGAGRPALPLARCVTESRCGRDFSVPARSPRVPFTGAVVPLPASQALLLRVRSDWQMVAYGSPAGSRDGTEAQGAICAPVSAPHGARPHLGPPEAALCRPWLLLILQSPWTLRPWRTVTF